MTWDYRNYFRIHLFSEINKWFFYIQISKYFIRFGSHGIMIGTSHAGWMPLDEEG